MMRISFKAPGGEVLSFTAQDNASPDAINAQIADLQRQYVEHHSASQMRIKTGGKLVTNDPEPWSVGRFAGEVGDEFVKEETQGAQGVYDALKPPPIGPNGQRPSLTEHYDPTNPRNAGRYAMGALNALRAWPINAGVNALSDTSGRMVTDVTGSPAAGVVADLAVMGGAFGAAEKANKLLKAQQAASSAEKIGEGARAVTPAEAIALETNTPAAVGQETILPNKYAEPPPSKPPTSPVEIGKAALRSVEPGAVNIFGEAAQTELDDLKKRTDQQPPPRVITLGGRKGRVANKLPDGRVAVQGDDGVVTAEDPKRLMVEPDEDIPTPGHVPPAIAATESEAAKAPGQMDRLRNAVNARKPSLSEALHASQLKPEYGLRPAVRVGSKVVPGELGDVHNDILERTEGGLRVMREIAEGRTRDADVNGYVDTTGKWISRADATRIVRGEKAASAAPISSAGAAEGEELPPEAPPAAPAPAAEPIISAPATSIEKKAPEPAVPSTPAATTSAAAIKRNSFKEPGNFPLYQLGKAIAEGGELDEKQKANLAKLAKAYGLSEPDTRRIVGEFAKFADQSESRPLGGLKDFIRSFHGFEQRASVPEARKAARAATPAATGITRKSFPDNAGYQIYQVGRALAAGQALDEKLLRVFRKYAEIHELGSDSAKLIFSEYAKFADRNPGEQMSSFADFTAALAKLSQANRKAVAETAAKAESAAATPTSNVPSAEAEPVAPSKKIAPTAKTTITTAKGVETFEETPEEINKALRERVAPPPEPARQAIQTKRRTLLPAATDGKRLYLGKPGDLHGSLKLPEAAYRDTGGGFEMGFVDADNPNVFLSREQARALIEQDEMAAAQHAAAKEPIKEAIKETPEVEKRAVQESRGLSSKLEPHTVSVGDTVATKFGIGKVSNSEIGTTGDFVFDVKLATGRTVKVSVIFKPSTAGMADPFFVPHLIGGLADQALIASDRISRTLVRPLIAPHLVSEDAMTTAARLRVRLGELNANRAATEHRFQEMDEFFRTFTDAQQAQIFQRFQNGTKQVGQYAAKLDAMMDKLKDALKRREEYYIKKGWGLQINNPNIIASIFKDGPRATNFANLAVAREQPYKGLAKLLQSINAKEREDFFNAMMVGRKQQTPFLSGASDKWIGDFFRNFQDKKQAKVVFERMYGPNGVAGTKQAHYNFFLEGLLSEMAPVTYSPSRLVQRRLYEMDRAAMKDRFLEDMKDYLEYVPSKSARLPGYTMLNKDQFHEVSRWQAKNMTHKGEQLSSAGNWWAPDDVARVINNEFSPGIKGDDFWGKPYDWARKVTMVQTMSRLGVGLYHFTNLSKVVPQMAVGDAIQDLVNNRTLRGFKELWRNRADLPGIPGVWKGGKAWQLGKAARAEFFEKWLTDDAISDTVKHVVRSNMKFGHDEQYATQFRRAFWDALRKHQPVKAGLNIWPAALEYLSGAMFEHFIPNMKIGVQIRKMQQVLRDAPPGASTDEILKGFMKVTDEVENVLGAVNYQNYHIQQGMRDLMFVTYQAPGWFLGSMRQASGAMRETLQTGADFLSGRGLKIGNKTAFWLGVALTEPIANALTQYMLTGTFPEIDWNSLHHTMLNFYSFKTGRLKENGEEERGVWPGYHKELVHLGRSVYGGLPDIASYIGGKTSGTLQDAYAQIFNKDFYNNAVYTPMRDWSDWRNATKQIPQRLGYEISSSTPIALSATGRAARQAGEINYKPNRTILDTTKEIAAQTVKEPRKALTNFIFSTLGETPAPAYMTRDPLMKYLYGLKKPAERTVEGSDRAAQRYDLTNSLRRAKTQTEEDKLIASAGDDRDLKPPDIIRAQKEAAMTSLQLATQQVKVADLLYGMWYATPVQRRELLEIIINKYNSGARNRSQQENQQLMAEINKWQQQGR